jgi:NhaP-type Na+/H+ and K+/H+ antiporter
MKNWLYPEAVKRVEKACTLFLAEQLDVTSLQADLYRSEQEIQALDEKWFRALLFEAENKLEEIAYMVPSGQQKKAMKEVVLKLLTDIHNEKPAPPAD